MPIFTHGRNKEHNSTMNKSSEKDVKYCAKLEKIHFDDSCKLVYNKLIMVKETFMK